MEGSNCSFAHPSKGPFSLSLDNDPSYIKILTIKTKKPWPSALPPFNYFQHCPQSNLMSMTSPPTSYSVHSPPIKSPHKSPPSDNSLIQLMTPFRLSCDSSSPTHITISGMSDLLQQFTRDLPVRILPCPRRPTPTPLKEQAPLIYQYRQQNHQIWASQLQNSWHNSLCFQTKWKSK